MPISLTKQSSTIRPKHGKVVSHCKGHNNLVAKQQGIALFQVLLITAVISILAIQFTQTARNQLSIASTIVDRVQAQADLRTAEAELLFSLITEKREQDPQSNNAYAKNWNFYGKPFELSDNQDLQGQSNVQFTQRATDTYRFAEDGSRIKSVSLEGSDNVRITLQDQTGLISLYNGNGIERFEQLLNSFAANPKIYQDDNQAEQSNSRFAVNNDQQEYSAEVIEQIQASIMANSMADWQDADEGERINGAEARFYNQPGMPTNLPLQTYQELRHVRGFNRQLLDLLWPFITIRAQGYSNPMIAPPRVMALYMPQDRVDEIVRLRNEGLLERQLFETLSGLEVDETINFASSGLLRIKLEVRVNQVLLTKYLDIMLQPYDKHPYIVYEIKI